MIVCVIVCVIVRVCDSVCVRVCVIICVCECVIDDDDDALSVPLKLKSFIFVFFEVYPNQTSHTNVSNLDGHHAKDQATYKRAMMRVYNTPTLNGS